MRKTSWAALFLICAGADEHETRKALMAAGASAVRELHASSLHATFLTQEEWQTAGVAVAIDRLARLRGVRENFTLVWNANNTYGFNLFDLRLPVGGQVPG